MLRRRSIRGSRNHNWKSPEVLRNLPNVFKHQQERKCLFQKSKRIFEVKEAGLLTDKLQIVSILLCVAWKACSKSVRKQLLFAFGSCKNRPSVRVEEQNDAWVLFAARAVHPVLSVETPFLSNFKYILLRDNLLCHVLDSNDSNLLFLQKCSCFLWRLDYDCAALYTMIHLSQHITRPTSRKIRKLFWIQNS